jgi:hypothetical protein
MPRNVIGNTFWQDRFVKLIVSAVVFIALSAIPVILETAFNDLL